MENYAVLLSFTVCDSSTTIIEPKVKEKIEVDFLEANLLFLS